MLGSNRVGDELDLIPNLSSNSKYGNQLVQILLSSEFLCASWENDSFLCYNSDDFFGGGTVYWFFCSAN